MLLYCAFFHANEVVFRCEKSVVLGTQCVLVDELSHKFQFATLASLLFEAREKIDEAIYRKFVFEFQKLQNI